MILALVKGQIIRLKIAFSLIALGLAVTGCNRSLNSLAPRSSQPQRLLSAPVEPVEARQKFVYRFPAADHAFTIAADRIQPEVNIAELVLYQLAETDRVIKADVELDVREAPIREWDFGIPSDYSVVSVTGASVADYIAATEVADASVPFVMTW